MPIINSGGTILYTVPQEKQLALDTFSFGDEDISIHDVQNVVKQIKFDINPTTSGPGSVTLQCDVGSADSIINLTTVAGTYAFGIIQPDSGTSPTADTTNDTLTVTSSDSSILVSGNSATDTLTLNFQRLVTGSAASPTLATTAVSLSLNASRDEVMFIAGNGAVAVLAAAQLPSTNVGKRLMLIGKSDTNTVTLTSGGVLSLNGDCVLKNNSVISLISIGTGYVEESRNDI